eukprot:s1834_g7.t1
MNQSPTSIYRLPSTDAPLSRRFRAPSSSLTWQWNICHLRMYEPPLPWQRGSSVRKDQNKMSSGMAIAMACVRTKIIQRFSR